MKRYILIILAILLLTPLQSKNFAQENDPYVVFMSVRSFYDYATGSSDHSQRTEGLYAIHPDGSDEQLIVSFEEIETALQIVEGDYVREMSLSPDGTRAAVILALRHRLYLGVEILEGLEGIALEAVLEPESMPTQLYLVNLSDGAVEQLSNDEHFNSSLAWSPNGTHLAYARTSVKHDDDTVFVINVETGEITEIPLNNPEVSIIPDELNVSNTTTIEATLAVFKYLSWSPDSEEIAISVRLTRSGAYPYYTTLIAKANGSEVWGIRQDPNIPFSTAVWDSEKKTLILACETSGNQICQYDLQTEEITPVFSLEELNVQFDWVNGLDVSEDGRIVFSAYSREPANKMWVYNPATETLDFIAPDEASASFNYFPRWFEQLPTANR